LAERKVSAQGSPPVTRITARKLLLLAAGGAFLFASVGMALKTKASTQQPVANAPALIPVTTQKVIAQDLQIERAGLGTVVPLNTVDVKARVDGYLQRIAFVDGQEVKAGDALAEIDPRPYQAQLAQAEAVLQRDSAQLASDQREEARANRLSTTGAGSTQASDLAKAATAAAQALLAADQAAVDTAKLNLAFTKIVAPFEGRVGLHQVSQGALVHANDTVGIITVSQTRPIAVQFSLSQDVLPDLERGQARGDLSVAVETRDGSPLTTGKLTALDNQIDPTTGMIKLKAVFDNANELLWPGELVMARVTIGTDSNASVVPSVAIQNGQTGPYVFVLKPDSTVSTASVKVGPTAGDVTAIVSGVKPGDDVVVSGQSRLAEGTKVNAKQSAASGLASAAVPQ
jgi:multidrug efflux system membrane fusion protein